jgi:glutamine synthetase
MAAMLLAGIDGIQKGIDPSAAGFGPINENIFDWPEEKRAEIKSLPTAVKAAMQALEGDSDFLKVDGIFDDTLIQTWKTTKRKEAEGVNQHPSPFEIENYYDC